MVKKKPQAKQENRKTDVESLKENIEQLKKHILKHKHDYPTKRALIIKEAKLKKLGQYLSRQ